MGLAVDDPPASCRARLAGPGAATGLAGDGASMSSSIAPDSIVVATATAMILCRTIVYYAVPSYTMLG